MGTMNFSIPDDLKDRFNEVFKDKNKSAIVAQLMERAVEAEERRRSDRCFEERLHAIRAANTRLHSDDDINAAREELRR